MSLAMCQAETKPDEAPKTLQRAYDLAVTAKLDAIKKEVAMLQVGQRCQRVTEEPASSISL